MEVAELRRELDALREDNRAPVVVNRLEPVRKDNSSLLRVDVTNVGMRRATYYARFVKLTGCDPMPEPFEAAWRGRDPRLSPGSRSLIPDAPEMINVATGRWYDGDEAVVSHPWGVCVPHDRDGSWDSHGAGWPEVTVAGDLIGQEFLLELVIFHEESQRAVARERLKLFYKREGSGFRPDLEKLIGD